MPQGKYLIVNYLYAIVNALLILYRKNTKSCYHELLLLFPGIL